MSDFNEYIDSEVSGSIEKDFQQKFIEERDLSLIRTYHSTLRTRDFQIVKQSKKQADLSSTFISTEGVVSERWLTVVDIPSVITEINQSFIVLECLMDKDNMVYLERKVERAYLEGIVPLEVGQLVLIKQRAREGRILHDFENGSNIIPPEYFEFDEDPFKGLNLSFSKKL